MSARSPNKSILSIVTRYSDVLVEPILLTIAFFTSLLLMPFIKAPFHNPHNIINQYNGIGFNPNNNFTGILFVILFSLGFFLVLRWLYNSQYRWVIKVFVALMLVGHYFIFYMLANAVGYTTGQGGLDNFHSGEQLSPAHAYLSGTNLYSNMFFLRGAGVDAVIPAIGLLLFGKSIGSFLLFNHLLMAVTMLGFFGLMAFVIRNTIGYIVAITLFYASNAISLVQIRDIPVWIVMGLVLLLFKADVSAKPKRLILIAIGILSSLELYISIDRGMLLVVLALLLGAILAVFSSDTNNTYKLSVKTWRTNIIASLYIVAGLLIGLLVPAVLLGWQNFTAFLKMTFLDIPAYAGLLVSQPFPPLFDPGYLIWGPVLLTISCGYLLIKLYSVDTKKELSSLIPYTLLLIFGALCLKAGANRIHVTKMASVATPLFFIAFVILIYAILYAYNNKRSRAQLIAPIILCIAMFAIFSQMDFAKLFKQPAYSRAQLAEYARSPKTADDVWLSQETQQVKHYISKHTSKKDYIFAFTSDPAYYYLADRKNPTRFYISWYADPQPYTNEMLHDLKNNKPKLIIFKESTWMDAPDNIPMEKRIPEVADWITKNYQNKIIIGNTTILK